MSVCLHEQKNVAYYLCFLFPEKRNFTTWPYLLLVWYQISKVLLVHLDAKELTGEFCLILASVHRKQWLLLLLLLVVCIKSQNNKRVRLKSCHTAVLCDWWTEARNKLSNNRRKFGLALRKLHLWKSHLLNVDSLWSSSPTQKKLILNPWYFPCRRIFSWFLSFYPCAEGKCFSPPFTRMKLELNTGW